MNTIHQFIRRFRPGYTLYNIFKKNKLAEQSALYKKIGLRKSYYSSISSNDFKSMAQPKPWLDEGDSASLLPANPVFQSLPQDIQESLLPWSKNGYAILRNFFSPQQVDTLLSETNLLIEKGKANWRKIGKERVMFAINQSSAIRNIVINERLNKVLDLLLGKEARVFQSINFFSGSEQAAHSDTVHMTTYPLGYMIAVWIALEDISEANGPLSYYPGSHKLPYILNDDFNHGNTSLFFGSDNYANYEKKIAAVIKENGLKKETFLAKKGDLLIWHANLIHAGEPILNPGLTRNSMVLHYFAKGVICYHEITQRPALFLDNLST